jgi:hypothetical protein
MLKNNLRRSVRQKAQSLKLKINLQLKELSDNLSTKKKLALSFALFDLSL